MMVRFERMKQILKPKYYKQLCEWMRGQTCDEEGIYDDDLLKWIKCQRCTD